MEPEKVEPALVLSYLQGKLEEQIEDLFEFHFSGTRQSPLLFSPAVSETQRGEERHPPPQKKQIPLTKTEQNVTLLGDKRQRHVLYLHREILTCIL